MAGALWGDAVSQLTEQAEIKADVLTRKLECLPGAGPQAITAAINQHGSARTFRMLTVEVDRSRREIVSFCDELAALRETEATCAAGGYSFKVYLKPWQHERIAPLQRIRSKAGSLLAQVERASVTVETRGPGSALTQIAAALAHLSTGLHAFRSDLQAAQIDFETML